MKNKDLTPGQKSLINKNRLREFGKGNKKDFSVDYEPQTKWFFVKKKGKIVSFGGIRPMKVKYKGKTYNIGGVCSTIAVIKKKGYGKLMANAMVKYSKKNGKTILAFTEKTKFFAKCGWGTKKDFIRRFVWVKLYGEKEYDTDGDGVFYEGSDKLVSKVLNGKGFVEIPVEFW